MLSTVKPEGKYVPQDTKIQWYRDKISHSKGSRDGEIVHMDRALALHKADSVLILSIFYGPFKPIKSAP